MKVRYVCSDGLVHSDPVNGESEGVTKNERRQARVVYGPYGIHYVRTTSVVGAPSPCRVCVPCEAVITDVRAMSSHDSKRLPGRSDDVDRRSYSTEAGRKSDHPPCRRLRPAPRVVPSSSALVATWLILPVVICLSQRLSHACLSTNFYTVKLRMAH